MRVGLQRLSLRGRLIAGLALVLTVSLAIGTAIALHTATHLVSTELRVALAVGGRAVREGIADLPADPGPALRRLVAGFDGDRHVTARLLDASGQSVAWSALSLACAELTAACAEVT